MKTVSIAQQRGLSMIELLVALAISSFLILGITQVYIDNKRNYIFQQSQANNQESTRFAELTLNAWLDKAGYRRAPDQDIDDAFPAVPATDDCEAFIAGAAITELRPDSAHETGLCLRYQPTSSTELDCQGAVVRQDSVSNIDKPFVKTSHNELVVLALKFVPDADQATELNRGSLQCKNLARPTPVFVELLDGLADMRFEFAKGDNDLFEKKLKDNPWNDPGTGLIRAVRYSILFASRPNQRDGDSRVYSDWINTVPVADNKTRIESGDNRRVYQLAGSTQTLRNMMP